MDFEKKKVLVVGMARSGVAAAQLLRASGAVVTVNDSKTEEELGQQLSPLEDCRSSDASDAAPWNSWRAWTALSSPLGFRIRLHSS